RPGPFTSPLAPDSAQTSNFEPVPASSVAGAAPGGRRLLSSEEPSPGSTGTSAARLPLWHNSGRSSSEPQLADVLLRNSGARGNAAVAKSDGPLAFQWPAFSKHGAVSSPPGMPARHPGPHAPEALGAAACP